MAPWWEITGFPAFVGGRWLELLSDIAGLKRAAIMFNPDTAPASAYTLSLEAAATVTQARANHPFTAT